MTDEDKLQNSWDESQKILFSDQSGNGIAIIGRGGLLILVILGLIALSVLLFRSEIPSSHMAQVIGEENLEMNGDLASSRAEMSPVVVPEKIAEVEITYEDMFREIGHRHGLHWRLLAKLAYRESRLDPLAVGKSKDMGLMQIIPSTWDEWAPKVGVSDPYDPYSNVLVGAAYLAFLKEYLSERGYPEDYWMVIAYNWGPNNVRQLLENDGRWTHVPGPQRQYTLDIMQPESSAPVSWENIQAELVVKTSIRR